MCTSVDSSRLDGVMGHYGQTSEGMTDTTDRAAGCVGLELGQGVDTPARPDGVLSPSTSRGAIPAVTTREDVMLARAAIDCMRSISVR